MNTFLVLSGLYLFWFALRVSVFNYPSQRFITEEGSPKEKQIYWGGIPLMIIGVVLFCTGI